MIRLRSSVPGRTRVGFIYGVAALVAVLLAAAIWSAGALTPAGAAAAGPAEGAILKVNTTADRLHRHGRLCSLREAIETVSSPGTRTACGTAKRTSNTIIMGAGHFVLRIHPTGADNNSTGDLNITAAGRLSIVGAGRSPTVISAKNLGDRVLSIAARSNVTLKRLTITGGHPPRAQSGSKGADNAGCSAGGAGGSGASGTGNGGGIENAGRLTLDAVAVVGNTAGAGGAGGNGGSQNAAAGCTGGVGGQGADGGGVYNRGRVMLIESTIRGNSAGQGGVGGTGGTGGAGVGGQGGAGGSGGDGGGIYNRGELLMASSTISANDAGTGGAGGAGGPGTPTRGGDGQGGVGASGGATFSIRGALNAVNDTFANNKAGTGGQWGGGSGNGGTGGNGGAIQLFSGAGRLINATVADNAAGTGGAHGSSGGSQGADGAGGDLSGPMSGATGHLTIENTIAAASTGSGCFGKVVNGGHDLSYGAAGCPGQGGSPKLEPLANYGGLTATFALGRGSPAIDRVPITGAHCPSKDERGVRRPQGRACDIGAFEFALPKVRIALPGHRGTYLRGSRVLARFRCSEGGIVSPIASCRGTVSRGHPINTRSTGAKRFKVTAVDKAGNRVTKVVRYSVWAYVNPLRAVSRLQPGRIDMGVDYAASGPILALGNGRVTFASNHDSGPPSCYGRTCWPGGGAVVYRLADGPFAGKYVYAAENITVSVSAGQRVRRGQRIATVHDAYPYMETGWGSGKGPETLAIADGHQCTCYDPGGWSSIEGRNFDRLLVFLGAPSGYVQPNPPNQRMPRGWPRIPTRAGTASIPRSATPLAEGAIEPVRVNGATGPDQAARAIRSALSPSVRRVLRALLSL